MFISNNDGYYFVVDCSIDVTKLVKCDIHKTKEDMYKFVSESLDLHIDEVEGNEMHITDALICYDSRCCGEDIEDSGLSVEEFINTFEM